jgi:hypothetical protein
MIGSNIKKMYLQAIFLLNLRNTKNAASASNSDKDENIMLAYE